MLFNLVIQKKCNNFSLVYISLYNFIKYNLLLLYRLRELLHPNEDKPISTPTAMVMCVPIAATYYVPPPLQASSVSIDDFIYNLMFYFYFPLSSLLQHMKYIHIIIIFFFHELKKKPETNLKPFSKWYTVFGEMITQNASQIIFIL